jgi:hypothetical protein
LTTYFSRFYAERRGKHPRPPQVEEHATSNELEARREKVKVIILDREPITT